MTKDFASSGQVLHLDGDPDHLKRCLIIYNLLEIQANGYFVPEKGQPHVLPGLLAQYNPHILVLTGHDGIIREGEDLQDINNYFTSRYFLEGVRIARQFEPDKDKLVIFAGACQSHFEAILSAGVNYASSPRRSWIHVLDPVFSIEKALFTSVDETVSVEDVVSGTVAGADGIGGIETRGALRTGGFQDSITEIP